MHAFVWIILIKGRLTNQFFSCGRFFETPSPLTEKRQWPKIPKIRFFFDLDWAHRRAKSRYGFDLLRFATRDPSPLG